MRETSLDSCMAPPWPYKFRCIHAAILACSDHPQTKSRPLPLPDPMCSRLHRRTFGDALVLRDRVTLESILVPVVVLFAVAFPLVGGVDR